MSTSICSGTIAILTRGSIIDPLETWLGQTREQWPGQVYVCKIRGNQIARQRNLAVEGMQGQWLLFVDSDTVPPPDALPRLLEHPEPIVAGVVLERYPPWNVAAWDDGRKLTLDDVPPALGLRRVGTVGMACTRIYRSVFEAMTAPWFRCGQLDPQVLTEDTEFCLRARDLGFSSFVDCQVRAGHQAEGIAWPGYDGQRWMEWIFGEKEAWPG